jgi:cytochrome P450
MLLPRWTIPHLPLSSNRILIRNTGDIRESSRDLIRSKREALEQGEEPQTDVLEVLLSSALSEEQLIDQVMTFLAAGHETTAATLTWTVYVLSKHQDIQAKLREEIRSAIPSSETAGELTSEVFEGMTYLQAFISELLRYYPAVPHLVREAVVDTTLVGRHIPKGTRFIVSPGAICYSTEIWGPDAGEFKPERWLKDSELGTAANGGASSKYGFITFLHGHRGCIGQGFTRGEMACILAAWVGKLQFELHDKADEDEWSIKLKKGGITYHPASGPMIDVKVLEGW